ncbi:hypothetical protein [Flavobacterium phycosphaerae]|uniref:hypothetical protein n=1 Tax=Flavobacterium phycosphaerae TaxID=2697515 RepID=UPI00138B1B1E|nr:hypothetical protein [Flavobacterium phycosphaerae]
MGIFNDYVSAIDECAIPEMPVNHIANIKNIEGFLAKNGISNDYLIEKCEVFGEHYLYIFYGRAAFKLNKHDAFPMCFVFKKPTIQPVKSFPFDSGAFHHDRMEKYFFNTKLTLDDFDFSGNNDYIYRVINHFFENNAAYYDEKNKSAVPDDGIPAIKGYLEMIADDRNDKLDGRKSAIELIYDFPFHFSNGLELVILPEFDLKFSTGNITFNQLKTILQTRYGCDVKSYSNRMTDPVESSYKEIKKIVKSHIKNNGGL